FFGPAFDAVVPRLVPAGDLVAANAINGQNRQLTRLIGPVLGGVLAATGGVLLVAVVDLVSYLLAAALVAMVRAAPAREEAVGPAPRSGRLRREWAAGIRVCFGRRELTTIFVFRVLNGFGEGVLSVLLAPLIIGVLNADSAEYGSVLSTQAIGGIAGALAVAALGSRFQPRFLLGYGALLFGILDLAIALYPLAIPRLWPLFVLICLVGAPAAAMFTGFNTIQQLGTPDDFRGRVFGAISTGWATAMVLGVVVASTLGDVVGVIAVISLQGVVHIIAGPFVLARLGATPAG
ncbi:MFS transporter, partial [Actinophytocola sp.]|uniref:MFS transporter n=1 Tax=Actinophytocola sp. TaxID=1872138 RepID=UPI00389AD2C9